MVPTNVLLSDSKPVISVFLLFLLLFNLHNFNNLICFTQIFVGLNWQYHILQISVLVYFMVLGEGNLIFCYTRSRDNCTGSFGQQNNNNNPKFQGWNI